MERKKSIQERDGEQKKHSREGKRAKKAFMRGTENRKSIQERDGEQK